MADPDLTTTFKVIGVKRRRLHEPVADQIRQAIFGGLIVPGHKLAPERELAEHFQTSRLALREALRVLEKEGLLVIKRGAAGGAFVAEPDRSLNALADSLNTVVRLGTARSANLTEMRCLLEPETARLATLNATPEELVTLEAVVAAQELELERGEISRKLDLEFHRCVAAASHNTVMSIIVDAVNQSLRDSILRSKRTHEMRSRVVHYHRNILDAIRGGAADSAKQLMIAHIMDVQCHIEASDNE